MPSPTPATRPPWPTSCAPTAATIALAGDSEEAEALKVLARAHQRLIWDRVRQVNRTRSVLREFFPAALDAFGTDLAHPDAVGLLSRAPSPAAAAGLPGLGVVLGARVLGEFGDDPAATPMLVPQQGTLAS